MLALACGQFWCPCWVPPPPSARNCPAVHAQHMRRAECASNCPCMAPLWTLVQTAPLGQRAVPALLPEVRGGRPPPGRPAGTTTCCATNLARHAACPAPSARQGNKRILPARAGCQASAATARCQVEPLKQRVAGRSPKRDLARPGLPQVQGQQLSCFPQQLSPATPTSCSSSGATSASAHSRSPLRSGGQEGSALSAASASPLLSTRTVSLRAMK